MRLLLICLTLAWFAVGCGGAQVMEEEPVRKIIVERPETPESGVSVADKTDLQEFGSRQVVSAQEAINISERLLREGSSALRDSAALDQLEKLLMKGLPQSSKEQHSLVLRNLGIVHYYKKQYSKARQELQAANETNPKDARTHYYLACIFSSQAKIYAAKGKQTTAKRQLKRAQIEIDTARKLEPSNALYRQGLPTTMENNWSK
jgi:tetratricopeptide (TPR) repeat protein